MFLSTYVNSLNKCIITMRKFLKIIKYLINKIFLHASISYI